MSLKTRSIKQTRKVTIDFHEQPGYALAGGVGGEAARTHGGREGEAPRAWPEEGATRAPLNGGAP